jgi:transcriptional regulator NrdR family protein
MKTYLLCGLLGMTLFLQILSVVFPVTRVATFNQDKVTSLFIQQLSKRHLSDEVIRQKTTLFSNRLKAALHTYAQKKHLLILKKEQVLAGENDVTDDIIHLMAGQVKHG